MQMLPLPYEKSILVVAFCGVAVLLKPELRGENVDGRERNQGGDQEAGANPEIRNFQMGK
jgi:hypothetical protein